MYPSYMNKPAFMTNTATTSFGASTSTFGQPSTNTSMFSSMQPSNIFQTPNTSSFSAGPTPQSSFGFENFVPAIRTVEMAPKGALNKTQKTTRRSKKEHNGATGDPPQVRSPVPFSRHLESYSILDEPPRLCPSLLVYTQGGYSSSNYTAHPLVPRLDLEPDSSCPSDAFLKYGPFSKLMENSASKLNLDVPSTSGTQKQTPLSDSSKLDRTRSYSTDSNDSGYNLVVPIKKQHVPLMLRPSRKRGDPIHKSSSPSPAPRSFKGTLPSSEGIVLQPSPKLASSPTLNLVDKSEALNKLKRRPADGSMEHIPKKARRQLTGADKNLNPKPPTPKILLVTPSSPLIVANNNPTPNGQPCPSPKNTCEFTLLPMREIESSTRATPSPLTGADNNPNSNGQPCPSTPPNPNGQPWALTPPKNKCESAPIEEVELSLMETPRSSWTCADKNPNPNGQLWPWNQKNSSEFTSLPNKGVQPSPMAIPTSICRINDSPRSLDLSTSLNTNTFPSRSTVPSQNAQAGPVTPRSLQLNFGPASESRNFYQLTAGVDTCAPPNQTTQPHSVTDQGNPGQLTANVGSSHFQAANLSAAAMAAQLRNFVTSLSEPRPMMNVTEPMDTTSGTNLFGQQQQQQPSTSGLFGSSNAFGQNKTSFGFGATPAQPGLFGQQPQPQTGTSLFQSNTPNLFGNSAFGNQTTGTVIKFTAVTGTDTMQKNGVTQSISTKHHCITCMKEYEVKSLEELRFEDYSCNRKGPQQQPSFGNTPFGAASTGTSASLFGQTENKQGFGQSQAFGQTPAFGQATPAFGVANQAAAPTLFGKPNTFGAATSATPTFGFNATPATSNPFSATPAQKPFSQPLFGTTTTQAQPTFGAGVFGQTTTQNTAANIFQKPAQPATGFNAGQQGFSFTQPTTQASNLFQVSKPNTGFGIFGQTNTTPAFGQTTQPTFGTNFGKLAPPTFTQPAQPTFGANLAGTLQQQPSLFGTTASKPPSLFGSATGGGSLFNNNVFQQAPFSLNLNQQPSVQFPPEQTEDKSINAIATDSFPDGPHVFGLEPIQGDLNTSTTNPKDLKQVLDQTKKKDDTVGARTKIRVHIPKPKRGNTYNKDFFETNQTLRNSHRCLIIRKFADPAATGPTIYNKYKNELLEEAEECLRRASRGTECNDLDNEGGENYSMLSPGTIPKQGEELSDYKARINKLRLQFDDSDAKTTEEIDLSVSASTGIALELSPNSKVPESGRFQASMAPPLDINEEEPHMSECDDDSPGTGSLELENVENPAGVILTKPEYYMYPALKDLGQYMEDNGECVVQGLTIGRRGYGNVYFPDPIDISNMNLDQLVHFRHREVVVYPDESTKPAVGEGLNRPAQVTLDKVYPREKGTEDYVLDVDKILQSNFVEKLMHVSQKHKSKFVDYRPKTGSWVFKVKHFSKYAFTESDDEECEIGEAKGMVPVRKSFTAAKQVEKEVEDVPMMGLGGGPQLLTNRLIPNEGDSFVMESGLGDMWPDDGPYTISDEKYTADSAIQKCSLFTNLSFISKERERLITTHHREPRAEVTATPRVHKLPDISLMIQPQKSTTTQRCYKDLGIYNNNTYKVGWEPGLTFYNIQPTAANEIVYNLSHCKIDIDNSLQYNSMMPNLIDMLNGTFEESDFSFNNKIPTLHIKKDLSFLQKQTDLFNDHARRQSLLGQGKYLSSVWNLCSALWGPGENSAYSRRKYLSDWLETLTSDMSPACSSKYQRNLPQTEIFKAIFKLLSFYKVLEASKFALTYQMGRLACLISQMSANERFKQWMQKYIESYTWKEKDVILDEFKKVYLLLAGVPKHNGINICDGLDWMQNFGLHLWYIAPAAAPIDVVFNLYKKAFEEGEYATKPIPPYCDSDIQTSEYDLLYHIIGVYVDSTYQLCNVLHPETHTGNIMDYRLSWLLLQLFLSLEAGLIRDSEKDHLHTTFSTQLENMGHWKWAIVVLLYLENNILKKNLITRILDRNVSAFAETVSIERELVQVFKIPASWIHEVKATKAKAQDRHYDYFQHSIYIKDGQQANEAFVNHIGPELFVNEQFDYLEKVIMKLEPFSSGLVNWRIEVGLFQDYLELRKSFSDGCGEGLIVAGAKLASLLQRMNCFPVKNERQTLCVTELSKKCALLFKLLHKRAEPEEYYTKFIDIFGSLFMTPDDRHHEVLSLISNVVKRSSPLTV